MQLFRWVTTPQNLIKCNRLNRSYPHLIQRSTHWHHLIIFPRNPHAHDEICTFKKSLRATSQHEKHLDRTSTTNWKSVCNRVQAQCRPRGKFTLYHWTIATIYGLTKARHLQGWRQGHYLLQASAVPQAVESLTGGKFVMSLVLWFLVQSVARC